MLRGWGIGLGEEYGDVWVMMCGGRGRAGGQVLRQIRLQRGDNATGSGEVRTSFSEY
jgi:hypothetical protein